MLAHYLTILTSGNTHSATLAKRLRVEAASSPSVLCPKSPSREHLMTQLQEKKWIQSQQRASGGTRGEEPPCKTTCKSAYLLSWKPCNQDDCQRSYLRGRKRLFKMSKCYNSVLTLPTTKTILVLLLGDILNVKKNTEKYTRPLLVNDIMLVLTWE